MFETHIIDVSLTLIIVSFSSRVLFFFSSKTNQIRVRHVTDRVTMDTIFYSFVFFNQNVKFKVKNNVGTLVFFGRFICEFELIAFLWTVP